MAIQALPPLTTRLIGSSQVLTTPLSLVKELLDNAIDARATSIDISVSPNTIDRIEVRDNGHGIALADLDSLGRRGYTSKLTSFEELRTLGGHTLGFRGEALASVVELAEVSITTRVEGEAIATLVKLKSSGGISSQSSASHPVGTTVLVVGFLSKLPVRKQTALKDAQKNLAKIKDLLQAYALARRQLRLSLKVLKNGKGSWSFIPHPNGSPREAIIQIIGRDAAAQCMEISNNDMPVPDCTRVVPIDEVLEVHANRLMRHRCPDPAFTFHVFLPKKDADFSNVAGGHYISIDGRPVSSMHGTPKKIIAVYKSYIRSLASEGSVKVVRDPFIYLSIICPPGSYDPNIEPAKDDVLFDDDTHVLKSVEELFKSVYGEKIQLADTTSKWAATPEGGFDLLLAKRTNVPDVSGSPLLKRFATANLNGIHLLPFISPPKSTEDDPVADLLSEGSHHAETSCSESNGVSLESDVEIGGCRSFRPSGSMNETFAQSSDDEPESHARNTLNPWLIAKLNAPIMRHKDRVSNFPSGENMGSSRELALPMFRLVTPCESLDSCPSSAGASGKPMEKHRLQRIDDEDTRQPAIDRWISGDGFENLDPTQQSRIQKSFSGTYLDQSPKTADDSSHLPFRGAGTGTAGDLPLGAPWSPPLTQKRSSFTRARGPDNPFVRPIIGSQLKSVVHNNAVQPNPRIPGPASQLSRNYAPLRQLTLRADVEEAMEFERRKEAATRRRREELRTLHRGGVDESIRASSSTTVLHMNILTAVVSELDDHQQVINGELGDVNMPIDTNLADGDPRAYLIRRQESMSSRLEKGCKPPKMKRAKTMLLPFEAIPQHLVVHDLVCETEVDLVKLQTALAALVGYDEYARSGIQARGLEFGPSEIVLVEEKLNKLVNGWLQSSHGEHRDVEVNLGFSAQRGVTLA